jgi:Ca2+/Na+ antiporter
VLKAFGIIFGIADAILDLIVLAVNDSLGDLVVNVAISRPEFPTMAH